MATQDNTVTNLKPSVSAAAQPTMANLRWCVLGEFTTRELPEKTRADGSKRAAMTMYSQPCVVTGGPRVLYTELSWFEEKDVLKTGCYMPGVDSFSLDRQFGRLEFRPQRYTRLRDLTPDEQAHFEARSNSLDDLRV